MALPPEVRDTAEAALRQFCDEHSSQAGSDQPRYSYEVETSSMLLIEQRPGFMKPDELTSKPIAKFRYSQARDTWTLYWADSNERWHRVGSVPAAKNIQVLLQAVLTDSSGVFWS
ncbi:MAG TPA: DUF3024 domain-containing protein [Thermoanaerobaculia bacterium]